MSQVTTRELQKHTREVRGRLEAGETLDWTLRGRVVARLIPVIPDGGETDWPNPMDRLQAIYGGKPTVESASASDQIYQDRG